MTSLDSKEKVLLRPKSILRQGPRNLNTQPSLGRDSNRGPTKAPAASTEETESAEALETLDQSLTSPRRF